MVAAAVGAAVSAPLPKSSDRVTQRKPVQV